MSEIFVKDSKYPRSALKAFLIKTKEIPYVCLICSNDGTWQSKKLSLHLDHINGVRNDNRKENLRFLCPNCHGQQETSHRKKGGNKARIILTSKNILDAREKCANVREILLELNVADATPNYAKVKRVLEIYHRQYDERPIRIKGDSSCPKYYLRRVERPTKEKLSALLISQPMSKIAESFGVTDNAVRKWANMYSLDWKKLSPYSHKI